MNDYNYYIMKTLRTEEYWQSGKYRSNLEGKELIRVPIFDSNWSHIYDLSRRCISGLKDDVYACLIFFFI